MIDARSFASPVIQGGAEEHFRFTPSASDASTGDGSYAKDWVRLVHKMQAIRRALPK